MPDNVQQDLPYNKYTDRQAYTQVLCWLEH